MTLRISAALAFLTALATGFASAWIALFYSEIFRGVSLPLLTRFVLWNAGVLYWLVLAVVIVGLYVAGERASDTKTRQRLAEVIMILGTVMTILFMIGAALPLTTIMPYLER